MSKLLEPKYDFKKVEEGKYNFWLEGGFFTSGDKTKEPFTIVIPPPNVTGKLHVGHACDTSIQDVIIRRKRMQGYDALWLPGMDHAGIATQAKVDEKLKQQGISRYDIGREEFLKVAWQWKKDYALTIRKQWAALGLSLDYTKERFTLDEQLNKAVNTVFIALYKKGYIYQGKRIINWDPEARTALSNIEVEHKDVEGAFYYFNYPFVDGTGAVTIATTRPETMFADQAIMVHPEDERYQSIIGKEVYIPGTKVKIPVIADAYVDKAFGTGCVKVTPAHDPNDYEVGLRHHLDMPLCMNDDGTMNAMAGKYEGMDRFACREVLLKDLEALKLFIKKETILHSVGHSERTGVVVEPRLSKQWFVKMDILAKQVLENKEYRFIPERFTQTLNHWLTNIQDWCISRQLWWGHRIPAWYKEDKVLVQVECPGDGWVQDEDVLDTWFSSALWPFSTLGWPEKTEDLDYFYPTDVLVTGYDIIFFWVIRMIFSGYEQMGKAPFHTVLFHGLVRDSLGRKMSKSLGNGIDPLEVIDKYGADALRLTLVTGNAPGNDMRFYWERVEASRNFANKIWNASRFIMMNMKDVALKQPGKEDFLAEDKWILSKVNRLAKEMTENMDKYELGIAVQKVYDFIWDEFCDWYIEMTKRRTYHREENQKSADTALWTLKEVLTKALQMLHPFMPFITEEIYCTLHPQEETIMLTSWPEFKEEYNFEQEEMEVERCKELVKAVRNRRSEMDVPPSRKAAVYLVSEKPEVRTVFDGLKDMYANLMGASEVTVQKDKEGIGEDAVSIVIPDAAVYIPLEDLVDMEKERERLTKEKERLTKELARSKGMLNNEKFLSKAPESKVLEEKEKLAKYEQMMQQVLAQLDSMK